MLQAGSGGFDRLAKSYKKVLVMKMNLLVKKIGRVFGHGLLVFLVEVEKHSMKFKTV